MSQVVRQCKIKVMLMSVPSHLVVFITGVRHVSGIDVHTPSEVEVVNGTNVKLKCTFTSRYPVTLQSVTASWNFRPLNSGSDETVCRNKMLLNVSLLYFNVIINEIQS